MPTKVFGDRLNRTSFTALAKFFGKVLLYPVLVVYTSLHLLTQGVLVNYGFSGTTEEFSTAFA